MSALQTYYLFEPVIAWRSWLIQTYWGRNSWSPKLWYQYLLSIYSPTKHWLAWQEKPMESICGIHPTFLERVRIKKWEKHSAPNPACSCGFYGTKELGHLLRRLNFSMLRTQLNWQPLAIGRVALWGKLIEHEQGYRAQFAWPVEIWIFGYAFLPQRIPSWVDISLDEVPYDLIQKFLGEHYGIQTHLGEVLPYRLSAETFWDSYNNRLSPIAARIGKIVEG